MPLVVVGQTAVARPDRVRRPAVRAVRRAAKRIAHRPAQHEMLTQLQFQKGQDPYAAETYRPLFVGQFDGDGQETMNDYDRNLLYWLVPTLPWPAKIVLEVPSVMLTIVRRLSTVLKVLPTVLVLSMMLMK